MQSTLVNSTFPVFVDAPGPLQGSKHNRCGMLVVHLQSLFRDLVVFLYHTEETDGKFGNDVTIKIGETGWGVPGLLSDENDADTIMYQWRGERIEFAIQCSIELRIGSFEKEGLAVPLPVPRHLLAVEGWYGVKSKKGSVDYRLLGEQ